jgi:phosphoribosylanthranilate isomerase
MVNGLTLKVCGLTSVNDAVTASGIGADYLGFIFHPASPRHVGEAKYARMAPQLPTGRKVAVSVAPAPADLARLAALGFDAFQVHFDPETTTAVVGAWAETVGVGRLWLAPRLPPGRDVSAEWLPFAGTFLLDAYHADKFGGGGKPGDWEQFRRHAAAHPGKTWILAGGLNPDNVAAAVAATGALFLDVNSGVESAPGVKSQEKLFALWRALERT